MNDQLQNREFSAPRDIRDLLYGIALGLVYTLFTFIFIYKGGFGEPDSAAIAVGIQQALKSGQNFGGTLLYLPSGHPLYYYLMFHMPGVGSWSLDKIIWVMNHCSWLAMGASLTCVYLLCRKFASRGWSLSAGVLLFTCPVFIDQGTYGHPVSVALFFFLAAALLMVEGWTQFTYMNARYIVLISVAALFLAASVCIRADIIFFFPALIPLALYSGTNRKAALFALVCSAFFASVSFLIARNLVTRSAPINANAAISPMQQAVTFITSYYHLKSVIKGLIYFPLATGLGISLVLVVMVALLLKKKLLWPLAAGALMIMPTFLFYIGNPLPSRHFLHASVGICLFLAFVGARLFPWKLKGIVWFTLILASLNLGFAPTMAALTKIAKIPTRNWALQRLTVGVFDWHRMYQDYLNWDQNRWKKLAPSFSEKQLLIGGWLENSGLLSYFARQNETIKIKRVVGTGANGPVSISFNDRQVSFLELDPSQPFKVTSEAFPSVIIVALFPPEQLQSLPPGVMDVYPWKTQYLIF